MEDVVFASVELRRSVLPFRFGFSHNLASRAGADSLFVIVRTASGIEGYGQALPRGYLTGETPASAVGDILERWWPEIRGRAYAAAADANAILDGLAPVYAKADSLRSLSSYSALEMAIVDAYAKACRIPRSRLWGHGDIHLPLVGVVSADRPGRARWMSEAMAMLGYRHFKVKVGRDGEADRKRLAAVRRSIGPDSWLAVDANCAWGPEEAITRVGGLIEFGVRLIEQPMAPLDTTSENMKELARQAGGIEFMADESLCAMKDAGAALRDGLFSWWNLRFGKCGGFSGVRALGRLAAERGIAAYGGVLVGETSALAAAGRSCADLIDFRLMEYGFPRILLRFDPFRGGPGGYRGSAVRPDEKTAFGLGVRLGRGGLDACGEIVAKA